MDKDIWIAIIVALPGTILGLFNWYSNYKKNREEGKKNEAEAINEYADASKNWYEHVLELQMHSDEQDKQIFDLRESDHKKGARIGELETNVIRLTNENKALQLRARRFEDWAHRLVKQLEAARIIPEPLGDDGTL